MKIDIIHPAHYRDDGSLVQSKNLIDRLVRICLTLDHRSWLR